MLPLILALPLAGFLILAFGHRLPDRVTGRIGVGSIAVAAVVTAWLDWQFAAGGNEPLRLTLWHWVAVGNFKPDISLYLDGLALIMVNVVTGVGFLIHLFAAWYMREDLAGERGYGRFFAYMNLFVFAMLLLVLGGNLLLLYLGWEGVGLCSYLLIGFYYQDHANAWAAFKAFIVTRVGDVLLAIGLFLLFFTFHTLDIQEIMARAPQVWARGDILAEAAALLLLGAAVGKSAQLPLQTWLPDAMAGPTPVSALIHAATMVTAGVYLIARTHVVFELAPTVLELVGIIGVLTLLLAGFSALCQTDIKRVLAYSTMSQIGYMFLALGVGAWDAAIFHLVVHAFFKALLFMASGSVIIACHHEQDMFRMGGLRHSLKLDYALFWIGGAALSALPLVTAGFYSKDEILWQAFAHGHAILWLGGLAGALLTSVYTFRMIFITFHGPAQTQAHPSGGISHHLPLIVLAVLSTFVGALIHSPMAKLLHGSHESGGEQFKWLLEAASAAVAVGGLGIAAGLFLGRRELAARAAGTTLGRALWRLWHNAWGFDWLYDRVFVRPYMAVVRLLQTDRLNSMVNTLPILALALNGRLTAAQNGQLRRYTLIVGAAAAVLLLWLVWV